jgi:hypothetical protein
MALCAKQGFLFYLAMATIQHGWALTEQGQGEEGIVQLRHGLAIEVARRQEAKSLELRATVSLGWLWQQQGKKAEAHRVPTEIFGWFSERFDTADLKEAKTLLEALS